MRRALPCPVLYHCVQPVSWLLLGELFPLEDRALGTAITTAFRSVPFCARLSPLFYSVPSFVLNLSAFFSYGCAFVGVKTFVDFAWLLGLAGTFACYAVVSLAGCTFYWLAVPETRQQPLGELRPVQQA